jgi:hypothetical protein
MAPNKEPGLSDKKYSCHILFSFWRTKKYFAQVWISPLYQTRDAHAHQVFIGSIQIQTAFAQSFFCSMQELLPHLR